MFLFSWDDHSPKSHYPIPFLNGCVSSELPSPPATLDVTGLYSSDFQVEVNLDFRSYLAAELEEQLLSCSFTTIHDMGDGMVVMLVSAKSDESEMMVFFLQTRNPQWEAWLSTVESLRLGDTIPNVPPLFTYIFYIHRVNRIDDISDFIITFSLAFCIMA